MIQKWNYKPLNEKEELEKKELSETLGISPVLAQLLIQRGITTFEEARKFFRPELDDLHDPFLMRDMRKAVDRLSLALGNKEKILIYGDYDVDGTTAVALVYTFLNQFYSSIDFYIPDRYSEGYGISYAGIDYAVENEFSLVIALDCGIKAVEKIDYATSKGVDFIICDHHTPDAILPRAIAVLDPKRVDTIYPYSHLSGCGVGFKFMQAFAMSNKIPFSQLTPLLDLVAVSIASDIVPITGENRIMAHYGLKQINSNPSIGLKSIIDLCGLRDKDIQISDIVFKIGPRINASGRMQTGNEAVQFLIAKDVALPKKKAMPLIFTTMNVNRWIKILPKKLIIF
jgi:single-stranded-DNA-specific exonuclease